MKDIKGFRQFFAAMSKNPAIFGKQFFPWLFYKPFAPFQKEIMKLFVRDLKKKGTITIVEVPRGFGKSVIIGFLLVLWVVVFMKLRYIVLISKTAPKAWQMLEDIKIGVSHPDFKEVFGDVIGSKWSAKVAHIYSEEWDINCTIEAYGLESQLRGIRKLQDRIQLALIDDPEDDDDADNPDRIKKKVRRITKVLEPGLQVRTEADVEREGGIIPKIWWLGTPIARDCVLTRVKDFEDVKTVTYPATIEGKSIWEEMFPTVWLDNKRKSLFRRLEAPVWWSEYMCDPRTEAELIFREPIRTFEPKELQDVDVPMYMAIDAAYTEKRLGCETGISVGGFSSFGTLYCFESVVGKFSPNRLASIVIDLAKKYKTNRPILKIGIESTSFPFVRDKLREVLWEKEKMSIAISKIKHPHQPKEDRMKELIQPHEDGRIFIRKEHKRLKEQMLNFPSFKGGSDALDSLAQLHRIASIPKAKKQGKEYLPEDSVDRDIEERMADMAMRRRVASRNQRYASVARRINRRVHGYH